MKAEYDGVPIRIFLIQYGKCPNWKVMITTDLSLSFNKTFEVYQIRWGIEVIFKECKQYLNLGKCQSTNFNNQIADCTVCFITHTILTLGKRFSDYETIGGLFRDCQQNIVASTLWDRTIELFKNLLKVLAEASGIDLLPALMWLVNTDQNNIELNLLRNLLCDNDIAEPKWLS